MWVSRGWAVDVWVEGNVAFSNAPFKGITDYAPLSPGTFNVQVVPTGATTPVVIDADLDLAADTDYTVVAVGLLADIEPLVLIDNNGAPAAGKPPLLTGSDSRPPSSRTGGGQARKSWDDVPPRAFRDGLVYLAETSASARERRFYHRLAQAYALHRGLE